MNPGSGMNELGFINNAPYKGRSQNAKFNGAPRVASKKGVATGNIPANFGSVRSDVDFSGELSEGGLLLSKRTEWLEGRERRTTATMNEQCGKQERHAEQLAATMNALESVTKETTRLNAEQERVSQQARQLYNDQQWVFGYTARPLLGIDGTDRIHKALQEYRSAKGAAPLKQLAPASQWAYLSYPMERVETDHGEQYLMKVKTVNRRTGQLRVDWAIVFESTDGKETRPIREFALVPTA